MHPPTVVTPLDGLRAAFPDAVVEHADADAAIARDADLVVVVVGYTKADEGEFIGSMDPALMNLFPPADDPRVGNAAVVPVLPAAPPTREPESGLAAMATGGDRAHLRLAPADEDLIVATSAVNERTVVAVMGGSAVVTPWIAGPAATLLLWYPGMEGGHALADVLTGAVPPGGRLPFAVPVRQGDLVHFDRDGTTETYDLFHGQWHLDRNGTEPAFPFGFGLSTTSFALDELHVAETRDAVSVRVTNTGDRDGVTVVQVYGGYEQSAYERPVARLVGFRRVELAAGRNVRVAVPVDLRMLDVRVGGAMTPRAGDRGAACRVPRPRPRRGCVVHCLTRTSPSWATLATCRPAVSNTRAIAMPRELATPWPDRWKSSHSFARTGRWNQIA